ncbi:nuclear pore complex protein Nup153-like isoform X2 [Anneissia japonica]|uniref:nuclear pore complex protein Nup153-like isoform X2 n=1 Tax=Anneissia japonica TaxID=1529436 RepID=UPI0014259491|nr:nuclear pore complex protein Nup153-like isoform X2 [Anneissia japonica]
MESKGGGKIQRKRARATAKPYSRATTSSTRETSSSSGHRIGADTNQSLLQRFSSSVLGFVTPSWLTNYWTSSQKNDKVASKADQSKRDDDKPGWPLPKERQDVDAHEEMQGDVDVDMDVVYVPQSAESKGTPFSSQKPLGTSTPVDDFNNRFKVCKDDASDVSMATSSVSMIPQVDITEHRDNISRSSSSKLEERTSAKPWINTTNTPRLASRPQPAGRNLQKPAFNSSYFGSPISGRESPAGPFASPFYPGRTTYGGASAQRPATSSKINSPYQVYHPIRRRLKPKQASNAMNSSFGVTSAAAKQILETLEKMSTPLTDAKKIPLSPTASPLVFNPPKRARTALRPGPPVAPRPVPTTHTEPKVRTPYGVPNSIPATPPTTLVSSVPNTGFGGGGKMKSKKKSAVHFSNKDDDENEMLEELDLPNMPLPLPKGKMPSFNLIAPSSSKTKSPKPVISTPSTVSKPAVPLNFRPSISKPAPPIASESVSAKTYTFSDPKVITTLSTSSSTLPMQFLFSAPTSSTLKRKETKNVEEEESTGGGLKPAKELKKGSCLEFLGIVPGKTGTDGSGNIKNTVIGFGDKFKKPGTWNCSTCLLDNKPDAKTCIACMAAKPKASNGSNRIELKQDSVQTSSIVPQSLASSKTCTAHLQSSNPNQTSSPQIGFGDKFKPVPGSWKCNVCLLNNKPERDTCIACAGPKPPTQNSIQPKISLAEQFKLQKGSWTCDVCLVVNKEDSIKCVACTAAKPATKSQPSSLGVSNPGSAKPAVSISSNMDLSHLKPPADNWTCSTCLISNKPSVSKCVACSSGKPSTDQTCSNTLDLPSLARIKKIMKQDKNVKMISAETTVLFSKAVQLFISKLSLFAWQHTQDSKRKIIQKLDVEMAISKNNKLNFLSNTISKDEIKSTKNKQSSITLQEQFAPPSETWSCNTCLIRNKSEDVKCVACGSAKPGSKAIIGFGDKFKPAPGSWTCDTCLIQNQKSSSKCAACEAVQPGCEPLLKAPPASVFKFGGNLNQSSSTEKSSSTFKFGGTAPPSSGGFTFGGSEQSKPPTGGGFTFGKPLSVSNTNTSSAISISETSSKTNDMVKQEQKISEKPTFQFRKPSSSEKPESQNSSTFSFGQTSEKATAAATIGGFSFGGQSSTTNSTEKPVNSMFNNTGESQGSSSGGFRFGNVVTTAAKTNSSSSDSTTFVFGAKSSQTNALTNSDGPLLGNGSENNLKKETSSSSSSSAFQLSTGSASTGFSFGSKNSSVTESKDSGSVFGSTNTLVHAGNAVLNNIDVNKPASGVTFQFGAASSTTTETKTPSTFVFSGQAKESCGTGGPPAKVGGFNFGSTSNKNTQEPAKSTNPSSRPMFTFGAKPAAEPPTFKFGQNSNPNPPAFGGFGAATNSASQGIGNSVNSSSSGFNFSSGSGSNSSGSSGGGGFNFSASSKSFNSEAAPKFGVTSSTPNFGASVNPVAPVPRFGGQNNSTIGGSGFGVGSSNLGSFGGAGTNNTLAPAFGSTAPQTNGPGGFQFNSNSNSNSNTSFQFGQQSNSSVFQFGAKNSEPAPPPSSSGFTFGSTPAVQPNNFGSFGSSGNDSMPFQSNAGSNDNPFNAVVSGSSNPQGRRIIKKAQRRIKKT